MTRSGILSAAFAMFGGVVLLLLGLMLAPSAPATSHAPAPFAHRVGEQTSESSRSDASYTEAELKSFADAALQVKHIKEVYVPQIAAAEDEEEQDKLKEAATKEMTQAVEERGLKVDRYQEILVAALTQPELAHRVSKYMSQPRTWV